MRDSPGRCRFCGCTYTNPCPIPCGWANREQTLCTQCKDIDIDFATMCLSFPKPVSFYFGMRRAFFRGWTVGAGDVERQVDGIGRPPYRSSSPARWWTFGQKCGRARVAAAAR